MSDISIYNVYDNVNYQYNNNILYVYWDTTNREIHDIMKNEVTPYSTENDTTYLFSCMWVKELKKCISWKLGDNIYIKIKYFTKGNMRIVVSTETEDDIIYDEIRGDGYLYTSSVLQKCNCVYNDLLDLYGGKI